MEISSNYNLSFEQDSASQKKTQIHVISQKEGDIYLVKIGDTVTEIKSSAILKPGSTFYAPVINDNGRLLVYINTLPNTANPQFSFFQKNNIPINPISTALIQYVLNYGGVINPEQIKKTLVLGKVFGKKIDDDSTKKKLTEKIYELLEKGMIPEDWEIEELLGFQFDFDENSGSSKKDQDQKQEEQKKDRKEAFLQVFNQISQGKFQKIVVPFQFSDADIKGSIHFLLDLMSKKVVQWEVFSKTNSKTNNDEKQNKTWHFSISNCKNEKAALKISSFPPLKKSDKAKILEFFSSDEFKEIFYDVSFFDDEKITETDNFQESYEATNIVV